MNFIIAGNGQKLWKYKWQVACLWLSESNSGHSQMSKRNLLLGGIIWFIKLCKQYVNNNNYRCLILPVYWNTFFSSIMYLVCTQYVFLGFFCCFVFCCTCIDRDLLCIIQVNLIHSFNHSVTIIVFTLKTCFLNWDLPISFFFSEYYFFCFNGK